MKILLALTFVISLSMPLNAQSSGRLRQVRHSVVTQKSAPRTAISTFLAFFEYVRRDEPNIVADLKAQERWLSKSLREKLMENNAAMAEYMRKNPDDKPQYPDNATFTGVWNQPTTFSIISSRQYDYRNADNANAQRVMIDVLYEWGHEKTIDNQYPGVRNLRTFIFVRESGSWKLDDIYIFNDEFATASSLRRDLDLDRP